MDSKLSPIVKYMLFEYVITKLNLETAQKETSPKI